MAGSGANEPRRRIRNSTAEFLIFTGQDGGDGIEVRCEAESIWLSQKLMAELFGVDVRTISEHLQSIFATGELHADSAIRKFRNTAADGKSYLTQDELASLGRVVNAYLELAEDRAKRRIPMTMEDWAKRLDLFLEMDERTILQNSGTVSARVAREFAESEFAKYRVVQDRLFESDFDREIKRLEGK